MPPVVGDIVIFHQAQTVPPINNTPDHPALVTRVWGEDCLNLRVFLDDGSAQHHTSVVERSDATAPDQKSWSVKEAPGKTKRARKTDPEKAA